MSSIMIESDTLEIVPWEDEVLDRLGHDPRSYYVERFWLSIIGPSATWLLRRIAAGFDGAPQGFEVSLGETAQALGLGIRGGRRSAVFRTFTRLVQFDLARVYAPGQLQVMRKVPPLNRRFVRQLSPSMREAHERWEASQAEVPPGEVMRRRSRQLALSLLELGEDPGEVEHQLLRWRYHPALSREAVEWATERHRGAGAEG